jgi:hypothetical protein
MAVQAQYKAACVLLSQAQVLLSQGEDYTVALASSEVCTATLRDLQQTLISFPNHIVHPSDVDALEVGTTILKHTSKGRENK